MGLIACYEDNSVIIGEIYRVPNTSVHLSLERYEQIMSKLTGTKPVIIGTDQNFDFLKIGTHVHIEELLNTYLSSSLLPTINKPTIIAHTSATIIDNLFVKYNHNLDMHSGIIISDMSDHLPIFCFLSYKKQKRKAGKAPAFESRPITVQITFIFIDFRIYDFAFAFKTQNAPCVSRFKRVLFFRQISICVLNANEMFV